jgi:segregation and condensation protein B
MERGLVRILGRKREVGRPLLYGTTRTFLEYFGFQDITDLPSTQELEALVPAGQEADGAVKTKRENP